MEKIFTVLCFFLNLEMWDYPYFQFSVALNVYHIGHYEIEVSNASHREPKKSK